MDSFNLFHNNRYRTQSHRPVRSNKLCIIYITQESKNLKYRNRLTQANIVSAYLSIYHDVWYPWIKSFSIRREAGAEVRYRSRIQAVLIQVLLTAVSAIAEAARKAWTATLQLRTNALPTIPNSTHWNPAQTPSFLRSSPSPPLNQTKPKHAHHPRPLALS